ncbi:MAG: DNA-binding protein [Candidatus Margulisbacteria bacterium]|nr:DNA-binding protein [Candidatus Margulisiibacteriota bacterium]
MDILNKEDLANYLKVDIKTINYLLYYKYLPKIKIGRGYRFIKHDIDAWIQTRKEAPKWPSYRKS